MPYLVSGGSTIRTRHFYTRRGDDIDIDNYRYFYHTSATNGVFARLENSNFLNVTIDVKYKRHDKTRMV